GQGGALWLKNSDGDYFLVETNNFNEFTEDEISKDEAFVIFLNSREWVINLDDYRIDGGKTEGPHIPDWLLSPYNNWLIQPFYEGGRLLGFMVITRPHGNVEFNWEDIDLLKTVGFQTAAYISLLRTSDALSEARQFETFNRLSAFMVHDIKNIVAQLNFIVSNYSKFGDNKDFIVDAMDTIRNATEKMQKLLGYLGKGQMLNITSKQKIDLISLLKNIVNARGADNPVPVLNTSCSEIIFWTDRDKLGSALQHLVQNAQEATQDNGNVWIEVEQTNKDIVLKIADNGCGMNETFIKTRLFKPFDTTKGNAGMGIGVYESREIIREMGGSLRVESRPGEGTEFSIILKKQDDSEHSEKEVISI
ncbi:MAG: PEP-CTERM system histidine kinase PrsK, partial [Gammaproteobacteria bacterium]|nr:PEP-CTERM system histidine kinase PrsK [Gammaproteobacteria bacterium]